jgi:hypothetical protein
MPVQTQSKPRIKTHAHIVVDEELWKNVKKIAIDVNRDASDLVELALRILLSIIESKRLPDNLAAILDKQALDELKKVVER